jgi:hypothetical protein
LATWGFNIFTNNLLLLPKDALRLSHPWRILEKGLLIEVLKDDAGLSSSSALLSYCFCLKQAHSKQ